MKKPKTILALFEGHKERWTKGISARDKNKEGVYPDSNRKAVCWCLTGAIRKIYGRRHEKFANVYNKLVNFIPPGYHGSLASWNDAKCRTFAQILAIVKKAKV